ncbi:tyrosine-type recombinase/integrase [Mailhella massiliensis]|uniref:tyrosine-type recombinase/integrase n=1 Tax=Mailhella massiliensis TaxID=1903261 RepID=UPI00097D38CB|nr:site-specific integrase [Mailhella massiliensis]
MGGKFFSTTQPGVFYRILKQKDPATGKPDCSFYISKPDDFGVPHWITVGRKSEGMTPRKAAALKNGESQKNLISSKSRAYTIGNAIEDYVLWASNQGKITDRPLDQYDFHCKQLIHNIPLRSFRPEQAEALKVRLMKKSISNQSVHHMLAFLRRAINYAIGMGKATHNPFRVLPGGVFRMPVLDNKRLRFLTPEECRILLAALKNASPQTYYMAQLSLKTGMRATEIFRLQWTDIDAMSCCLHIRAKGGRKEVVSAPREVIEMLLSMPRIEASPYCFPMPDGSIRNRTPATFNHVVARLGMQVPKESPYHISFHVFRHTFASWLAQSGQVTLHELMHLMRHRSIEMTQRYAHLIPSEITGKLSLVSRMLSQ